MNTDFKNIKAILFDSGHTLNKPKTGHWFFTPNFFNIINKKSFNPSKLRLAYAMHKANKYMNDNMLIKTEIEEFLAFKEFYSILLKKCNYKSFDDNVITALANDNVYNDDKFEFFSDVAPSLKKLKVKYELGIVSDTWPSLDRVFVNAGLKDYFSTFVMSSVYGKYKSEGTLFRIALEELNIKPHEAIFIDDSESNLKVAESLGLLPIKINRYNSEKSKNYYEISSLEDLINILGVV